MNGYIGSALHYATTLLMKDGGRVVAFTSQMANSGFGKLLKRENHKLVNTDREKEVYVAQNYSYELLGKKCMERRVSVDLFVFNGD